MNQKEVTTQDNTRWTCVQAFSSGENEELAEKAKEVNGNGKVDVVCTPSGGAQTVRLQLDGNWQNMPDDDLSSLIDRERSRS